MRVDPQRPGHHVDGDRARARDLGIAPGVFPTGGRNAITDVEGTLVGQVTLVHGDDVRTGVTAVLPHGGNLFQDKVAGGVFVGNASGKLAGSTQVRELGTIETPVTLTNTLSVGVALDTAVGWTLRQPGNERVESVNAVVGETNDGGLNDIRGRHVRADDVLGAIDTASGGQVQEGTVGAGTGTVCFGFKGGIGTSSRRLPDGEGGYTLGALVQANYGGQLTVTGVPVGPEHEPTATDSSRVGDGSCMLIVATDAPLTARDLERLAARSVFTLGRTGGSYSNGSGDYAVAFSTSPHARVRHGERRPREHRLLPSAAMSPLFQLAMEATEEAIYNALFMATTTTGRGRTCPAVPLDEVRALLARHGPRTPSPPLPGDH